MASNKFSSKRLADYLEKVGAGLTVLGFGGGWVSSQVSASGAVLVVGFGVILALFANILDQGNAGDSVMRCEPVGGGAFECWSTTNSTMLVYMGVFVLAWGVLIAFLYYRRMRKAGKKQEDGK